MKTKEKSKEDAKITAPNDEVTIGYLANVLGISLRTAQRHSQSGISLSRTLKNVKCVNADGAEKFKDMFTVRPYAIVKDCGFYIFAANEGKWVWELDGYRKYQIKIPAERWGWGNRFTLVFCGMKPEEELKVSVESGDCEGLRIVNPRTENLITLECDALPQGDTVINLYRSARDKEGSI